MDRESDPSLCCCGVAWYWACLILIRVVSLLRRLCMPSTVPGLIGGVLHNCDAPHGPPPEPPKAAAEALMIWLNWFPEFQVNRNRSPSAIQSLSYISTQFKNMYAK